MDILAKLSEVHKKRLVEEVTTNLTKRDEGLLIRWRVDSMHIKRKHDKQLMAHDDALRGVCHDAERAELEYTAPAITVPVVGPITDTAAAAMVSVFLATPEVFPIAQQPGKEPIVEAYNALLRKYASSFKWRSSLTSAIVKGVRHNFCAVEAGWKRLTVKTVGSSLKATGELETKEIVEEGVQLRALDSFNLFWDKNVLPEEVSEKGDYAGYVERFSKVQTVALLRELKSPLIRSLSEILRAGNYSTLYYEHKRPKLGGVQEAVNWSKVFAPKHGVHVTSTDYVEVLTMYVRTAPKAFGLSGKWSDELVVWKLTVLNGKWLAACEQLENMHGLIPICIARPSAHDPDVDWESLSSELAPFQKMATTLYSAEMAAQRKAARQRLLYDPSKLKNPEDLNVTDGDAHIAVDGAAIGASLDNIVRPVEVNAGPLQIRLQEAQQVIGMANLVGGQNQVNQGSFVKGNKTNEQFRQTLAGSSARTQLLAIRFEDSLFSRIRKIIASDMLQFQTPVTILDGTTGKQVAVDPVALRETAVSFELADGLIPINDNVTPELLATVFQTIVANPNAAPEFRVTDLVTHLLAQVGVRGLHAFKKSTDEIQREQQAQQMQQMQQPTQEQ